MLGVEFLAIFVNLFLLIDWFNKKNLFLRSFSVARKIIRRVLLVAEKSILLTNKKVQLEKCTKKY